MKLSFAPQGDFCHQTKVTKSWFKTPGFLKISFPQTLWFSPLNTGAEVTATVSAVEPLSRFVRHLFYSVPVSLLRLHDRSLSASPQWEPFQPSPWGEGGCPKGRRRGELQGLRMKISFAPQGDFCHQTKVTKSWFKNPWFLKISFSQVLWSSPLSTGAEVTAAVSAVEPLSRFVRHLFYPVPVSLLHLHWFMASVLRAGQCPPLQVIPVICY